MWKGVEKRLAALTDSLNGVDFINTIQRISTGLGRHTRPASTPVRGWCLTKNCLPGR
jgi:hypothetical protein